MAALHVAPFGEEESAAAASEREERRVGTCRALVEQRQEPLCRSEVTAADQRLDRDRARELRKALAQFVDAREERFDVRPTGTGIAGAKVDQRQRALQAMDEEETAQPLQDWE